MTRRLVLGCGTVGRVVLETIRSWPGTVTAVVEDEGRAEELRGVNVDARVGDPADPATYPDDVDVVLLASDDPETNRRAAAAARERYPDALVVTCTGEAEATDATASGTDRVVDPAAAVTERLFDLTKGVGSRRLVSLIEVLKSLRGPLAVVMHDNPDPDAIASAVALVSIANAVGVDADPCYFGDISHQENRALVNLLDLNLRRLEDPGDVEEYDGVALVDHSRPGVNDSLPQGTAVDVVVDHHPPRAPVQATYVDLRSEVGATSTLLVDYLRRFDLEPEEAVATALLYGIRIDTRDFTREVSETDFEAAAYLLPYADVDVLRRVETPNLSPAVLETLSRAIRDRTVRDDVLVSCVGYVRDRDTLAQAAERLLDMEGVRITLVFGIRDDTVYVSGRTRGTDVDLGETLRDALESVGSAGGHADMAGAQLSLGIIVDDLESESEEAVVEVVEEVVTERFFEALEAAPSTFEPGSFDEGDVVRDEYRRERGE